MMCSQNGNRCYIELCKIYVTSKIVFKAGLYVHFFTELDFDSGFLKFEINVRLLSSRLIPIVDSPPTVSAEWVDSRLSLASRDSRT